MPVFTPGDDRSSENRAIAVKNMSDGPGQSISGNPFERRSMESTMPPAMTLLTGASRAGSALFAVRDGLPHALRNGYEQFGHVTYNGFTMVEQSTGRGSVLYDKTQLEAHARDPGALDRELECGAAQGETAKILVTQGQIVDAHSLRADRERTHGHESPSAHR